MPKAKFANRARKTVRKTPVATTSMSSRRRHKQQGKRLRTGEAGDATLYISRTRAVKKLGVTLRDFRRLAILKGIYPRVPPHAKAAASAGNAYYHVKDIAYLSHEPLLEHFRAFKAFMHRVRRAIARHDLEDARRMYAQKTAYSLDHLVKERYPRFTDAVGDLDDALGMLHLFAALPAVPPITPARTAMATRLTREWQFYVARSRSLRKVFFSIKGVYAQASVRGVDVTWVMPWDKVPNTAVDADFRVMLTFMEFYETLLQFVMFKLYHHIGLAYPPAIAQDLDASGLFLPAVRATAVTTDAAEGQHAVPSVAGTAPVKKVVAMQTPGLREQLARINGAAAQSSSSLPEDLHAHVLGPASEDAMDQDMLASVDKDAAESLQKERQLMKLFDGLTFFLGREVPRQMFEFIVLSFGGRVGWEGEGSPFDVNDPRITHQVVDRPMAGRAGPASRELIQPQWIADSINARMLLPTAKYVTGAALPPHLSPFTDDYREGYVPAYREELDTLRAAAAATGRLADSAPPDRAPENFNDDDDDDDSPVEDDDNDDEDRKDAAEVPMASKSVSVSDRKRPRVDEQRALAESMLTGKQRKRYELVKSAVQHKKREAAELYAKRSGGASGGAKAGDKRRRA